MSTAAPGAHGSHPQLEGGWDEWAKLVLWRLEQLETASKEARDSHAKLARELAVLQVKVSLYAASAGVLASGLVTAAFEVVSRFAGHH